MYYCKLFKPNKLIFINFITDKHKNKTEKEVLKEIVEKVNNHRLENNIPVNNSNIATQIEMYKNIWNKIEFVNDDELAEIKLMMNDKSINISIFNVSTNDYQFLEEFMLKCLRGYFVM